MRICLLRPRESKYHCLGCAHPFEWAATVLRSPFTLGWCARQQTTQYPGKINVKQLICNWLSSRSPAINLHAQMYVNMYPVDPGVVTVNVLIYLTLKFMVA